MATNNHSIVSSDVTPDSTSSVGKRKTSRRSTGASTGKTARKSSPPAKTDMIEILFKDEPNPHAAAVPPYIWIDHPQESERLYAPNYVIRMGVGGAEAVELSIDEGAWQPCRFTSGYWWYDWHQIARGKHTLVARMRTSGAQWYRTPTRRLAY